MKILDYTNDPRWEKCSPTHKQFGISPNWFINVLRTYLSEDRLARYTVAVETGTFEGYTTECFAEIFDTVYTSEKYVTGNSYTSINLIEKYKELSNKYTNIHFYSGDSPEFLKTVLPIINQPTIFLLDAHTFNTTPIIDELKAIKQYCAVKDIVLVIDDCSDIGTGSWPTKEGLNSLLHDIDPQFNIIYTDIGRNILIAYE